MTEEKSLTLVVQEKTLGTLVTNAKQIRELVAQKIEEYSVDNYPGDEPDIRLAIADRLSKWK